jgi:hypothetical protein
VNASARNARLVLYVVAFLLMLAAGLTLVLSVRALLASTRLLWLSAGMSAAAIIAALASILWRARSRPGPQGDRSGSVPSSRNLGVGLAPHAEAIQ